MQIKERLYEISRRGNPRDFLDFFIEYPIHTSKQLRFQELENNRYYLANTPGIKLPNGNSFYFCRIPNEEFYIVYHSDKFQGHFISKSWEELWESDYEYKTLIFDAQGIDSSGKYIRTKMSDFPSRAVINEIYPPAVFAGDKVSTFKFEPNINEQVHLELNFSELLVGDINQEILSVLRRDPTLLHKLSPRKFEELIASILENHGYDVELTKQTRDGGYDIFCTQRNILGIEMNLIVECKKYAPDRPVGIEIARSIIGTKTLKGSGGAMLATTSYFSPEVIKLKSSRYDLHLADYEQIFDWLKIHE